MIIIIHDPQLGYKCHTVQSCIGKRLWVNWNLKSSSAAVTASIFSLPNFSVLPVEITNQSLFQWQLLCSAWSHESQPCKNKLRFTAAKKAAKSPQSQHVRCGVISNVVLKLTVWIFFSQKACISPRTYIMLP